MIKKTYTYDSQGLKWMNESIIGRKEESMGLIMILSEYPGAI